MEGQTQHRAGGAKRVLLVDDDSDTTDILCQVLERSGYQTRHAADGATALAVAAEFHPDVVFLDIGLPSMSGIDVANALRAAPGGQDLRIIALTGRDADARDGAGFDGWLTKPASLDDLHQVLS